MGVAAVDEDVAGLEERGDLLDDLSTAGPALTMIMTLRGRFSAATSSLTEWQPTMRLALGPAGEEVVDLRRGAVEDGDVKPWLSMFRTRFSPMTARPIRPMSAVGAVITRSLKGDEKRCSGGCSMRVRSAFVEMA